MHVAYRRSLPLDEVDGLDHVESELDAAVGVVGAGHGESGHAVVAVAQQLDSKTTRFLQLVQRERERY